MPDGTQMPEEPVIDAQKLRSLLDRAHNMKQASAERSSELGHHRKSAADQLKIPKDVWAIAERIDSLSDDKLGDFLRGFKPVIEAMMPQWDSRVQDMVDKAERQTDEMEGEMEGAGA
jgi:hypothetical protein